MFLLGDLGHAPRRILKIALLRLNLGAVLTENYEVVAKCRAGKLYACIVSKTGKCMTIHYIASHPIHPP